MSAGVMTAGSLVELTREQCSHNDSGGDPNEERRPPPRRHRMAGDGHARQCLAVHQERNEDVTVEHRLQGRFRVGDPGSLCAKQLGLVPAEGIDVEHQTTSSWGARDNASFRRAWTSVARTVPAAMSITAATSPTE